MDWSEVFQRLTALEARIGAVDVHAEVEGIQGVRVEIISKLPKQSEHISTLRRCVISPRFLIVPGRQHKW